MRSSARTSSTFPPRRCSNGSASWWRGGTGSTPSWPAPPGTATTPERDGAKSMRSWLCGHARLFPAAAGQLVRNGRALEQLPAGAAGRAAGMVTAEQVTVIAAVTRPRHLTAAAEQGVDVAEVDGVLAEVAATARHDRLGRVVHHYLARLDPDGTEPDPHRAAQSVDRQACRRQPDRPRRARPGRRGEVPGRPGVDPAGQPPRG
jgi:hypothetical protein